MTQKPIWKSKYFITGMIIGTFIGTTIGILLTDYVLKLIFG